ncbi:MAG: hypothetical protein HQ488_02375 [Parcubacteria group bacterium]|nr:hypothetical protein [Parcubacteria group bacterium]
MKPAIIALDLDLTLVNVFPGWEKMCGLWADTLYLPVATVIERGSKFWNTQGLIYTPELHRDALLQREVVTGEAEIADIADIDSAMETFYKWLADGHAVYDDVPDFIAWADACEMVEGTGIISFGQPEFQTRKLNSLPAPSSGFDPITFTNFSGRKARKLIFLHGRSRPIIFVDDNPSEHEPAMAYHNVRRVQILRDPDAVPSGFAQWHIRSLMEIHDLMPQLLAG